MIEFQKLTLQDIPLIRPYFQATVGRSCDATVGGVFLWRDFFETEYAFVGESLVFRVRDLGGVSAFAFPLSGDVGATLRALREDCAVRGERLVFCRVTGPDLRQLEDTFDCISAPERDWFDYIYTAKDLVSLAGRKYSDKRTPMNCFRREHPDHGFEPIGPDNLADVRRFYARFQGLERKNAVPFREDERMVRELLDNYETYGLLGGALRAAGEIVAFSVGEIVGDTLFVHVEKADFTLRGAYPMMVNEFAKFYVREGTLYINREDDAGDPGLRMSKLLYHPLRMIEKYTASVRES